MKHIPYTLAFSALVVIPCGCSPEGPEIPVGPCNSDGDTGFFAGADETGQGPTDDFPGELPGDHGGDTVALLDAKRSDSPNPALVPDWTFDEQTGNFHRPATPEECRRHAWPDATMLVALKTPPIEQATGASHVELTLPIPGRGLNHVLAPGGHAASATLKFEKLQDLALGSFVEHRGTVAGSSHEASVPVFSYFTTPADAEEGAQGELLMSATDGQVLLRAQVGDIGLVASGPHMSIPLDPAPPPQYYVLQRRDLGGRADGWQGREPPLPGLLPVRLRRPSRVRPDGQARLVVHGSVLHRRSLDATPSPATGT